MTKAFVCSVPKSGTYLVAEVLARLGMHNTRLHLNVHAFTDYSGASLETARKNPDKLLVTEPLEVSIARIGQGQFAVGHLPLTCASLLRDFDILFLRRNLRDALVSFCRWTVNSGRWQDDGAWRTQPDGPGKLMAFLERHHERVRATIAPAVDWIDEPPVTQISFEQLMGDEGSGEVVRTMRRIARVAGASQKNDAELLQIREQAMATETVTRSPARTVRETFWDASVEEAFVTLGLAALNVRLGYREPPVARSSRSGRLLERAAAAFRRRPAA